VSAEPVLGGEPDAPLRPTPPPEPAGAPGAASVRAPEVPAFADGRARALEPGWIEVETLARLLRAAILIALLAIGWTVFALSGPLSGAPLLLATGAAALAAPVLVGLAIWLPRLEHARAGWRVRPDRLEAWRGVIWRRSVSVPISRVQYVDVRQGPLERRARIASLVVHTAGTLSDAVALPGLAPALAHEVRDWLVAQTGADAV
jgi:hypothetical protein